MRSKRGEEPERDLVENIARAMHKPALMRRLASLEAAYSEPPTGIAQFLTPAEGPDASPALAPRAPPPTGPATSIESELAAARRHVEEAESASVMAPNSAEWLGNARRERNRARLRNAVAWIATLLIGGSIIATTALLLRP